eukprot:c21165_g1_i1.p1 GENE.c21165_g1_i1~~c21165_g1_i1.p1  ORF type:complete len:708 (+),score=81.51 c21165_g1_i1:34-2157(+)
MGLLLRVLVVGCVIGVSCLSQTHLAPNHSENTLVLTPLRARKQPSPGTPFEPSASPSPTTETKHIDEPRATVGNELSHRQYLDYAEGLQFAVPCLKFPYSGVVKTWEVYTGRDCLLELQVLRPAAIPPVLDESNNTITNYQIVGTSTVNVPGLGKHTFELSDLEWIGVQQDDVIGWRTSNPGCISWSPGGSPVLFRTSFPGHHELNTLGGMVFVGDGLRRTYSVSCSGTFVPPIPVLKQHESKSATQSFSSSYSASRTPSNSGSSTVSTTPVQSASSSMILSSTPTPTTTPSLSATPSASSNEAECGHGAYFWCASEENMRLCNVTVEICQVVMEALNPVLPSTVPSQSPFATPPPSTTPTLTPGLQPRLPSPTPSASLVAAPYEEFFSSEALERLEGTGLSACHYCNGGSDWLGGQCATGQEQSPVTINFETVEVDAAMDLYVASNYNQTWGTLAWNGYAYTISSPYFGRVNIDAVNYHADMAIIRAPSEHKIAGIKTPMELQIFHRVPESNPPKTLAIAVLFEETAHEVPELDWIFGLSKDLSPQQIVVRFENYFTDQRPIIFYHGSMTQPPCTEGILWGVSMGTAKVSSLQLEKLNSFLKGNIAFAQGRGNNRHPQPLNGRKLVMRSNCGISGSLTCERAKASAGNVPASQGGAAERQDLEVKEEVMHRLALPPIPTPVLEPAMPEKDLGDDALFGDDDGIKLW